jgi:hypothetical protein
MKEVSTIVVELWHEQRVLPRRRHLLRFHLLSNPIHKGVKRYLEGRALWDKKFSRQAAKVARQREKKKPAPVGKRENVKVKTMVGRLQDRFDRNFRSSTAAAHTPPGPGEKENATTTDNNNDANVFLNSPLWNWSWALEGAEDPPPSSIVARRDTVRFLAPSSLECGHGTTWVCKEKIELITVPHSHSHSRAKPVA